MKNTIVLGLFFVMMISSVLIETPSAVITEPEDVSVLIVLGDKFGWSYFELLEILQDWKCDITTAGPISHLESCANQPPRPIDVDVLFSDINREDLDQYDVLLVPSGAQWQTLIHTSSALSLINTAYEEGLIVSGICVGVIPLAVANVTRDRLVASHNFAYPYVKESGGKTLPFMRVVSDGNVITGDNGGGEPAGYESAPHYELCVAIMKKLFGYSYFQDITVNPELVGNDTVYYISVTTSEPIHLFDNVTTPEITDVVVNLHTSDNDTIIASVNLIQSAEVTTFKGNITGLELDDYIIDLQIIDANVSMEVVQDAALFTAQNITIPSTSTTSSATTEDRMPIETYALIGAVPIMAIIVFEVWRRRAK